MKLSTFLTVSLILFFAIGCKKQKKGRYLLVSANYTSANFLKQWNEAKIKELQRLYPNESFIQLYVDGLRNDRIDNSAGPGGRLLSTLHRKNILPDSIWYNAIYFVETENKGEYNSFVKYTVIDSNPDYYYKFDSGPKGWRLREKTEGDFSYLNQLYKTLSSEQHDSSRVSQNVGPITITKVNPDTLITKSIFRVTVEHVNRIRTLDKLGGTIDNEVL